MREHPEKQPSHKNPELLAPAGQVESFFAAVENGADAIYLGLKQLSARASAGNFTLEDLSTMVPFAHKRAVSIYVALNSLVTASEFPGILDLLQSLSDIGVDALIVQDPGILYLVRRYFPKLKLHASTLMAIHNHVGVNHLEALGAQRVVLARELTFEEIEQIAAKTRVDLEIFVHGALCFSYSGMCLASSFRGGHSGLQGRCVQPCRLRFRQGKKEGFYLSCNDFCALAQIPELKKLRLSAFKIEGRKKSADYIGQVVRAYRMVMDAPSERVSQAVAEAQELLLEAPARRLTPGFLGDRPGEEVLVPGRSGTSGLWVGTVDAVPRGKGARMVVTLRRELRPGDRLRPESAQEREEAAFSVSEVLSESGAPIAAGSAGMRVLLDSEGKNVRPGDRLFRVGSKGKSTSNLWQEIRRQVPKGARFSTRFSNREGVLEELPTVPVNPQRSTETLYLKIDSAHDLPRIFQSPAQNVILSATKANLERVAKQRFVPDQKRRFIWSLPPLLLEKEIEYYRLAVNWYRERGFKAWEVNNWGHFDLFGPDRGGLLLMAGYRFNLRNPAAMAAMAEDGCRWTVLSLETTGEELKALTRAPTSTIPVVTVYGWPPLFTSRLTPRLQEDRPFVTPRNEVYHFRKRWGYSLIYADRPMNWFGLLPELRSYGFRHFLLDLSEGPHDQVKHLERLLSGFKRTRPDEPYSLFNFDLQPVPKGRGEDGKSVRRDEARKARGEKGESGRRANGRKGRR